MAITRTVFITGGARRIGMAVAKYLHASGYNIIITYNNYSEYPKNHNDHYEYDIVIRTDYCKELSWLMYELGEIYLPKLGENTRSIYHPVGETINNSLKENKDIYSVFSDAMKKCEDLYSQIKLM